MDSVPLSAQRGRVSAAFATALLLLVMLPGVVRALPLGLGSALASCAQGPILATEGLAYQQCKAAGNGLGPYSGQFPDQCESHAANFGGAGHCGPSSPTRDYFHRVYCNQVTSGACTQWVGECSVLWAWPIAAGQGGDCIEQATTANSGNEPGTLTTMLSLSQPPQRCVGGCSYSCVATPTTSVTSSTGHCETYRGQDDTYRVTFNGYLRPSGQVCTPDTPSASGNEPQTCDTTSGKCFTEDPPRFTCVLSASKGNICLDIPAASQSGGAHFEDQDQSLTGSNMSSSSEPDIDPPVPSSHGPDASQVINYRPGNGTEVNIRVNYRESTASNWDAERTANNANCPYGQFPNGSCKPNPALCPNGTNPDGSCTSGIRTCPNGTNADGTCQGDGGTEQNPQQCFYGRNPDGSCANGPTGTCQFGANPDGTCQQQPGEQCPFGRGPDGACVQHTATTSDSCQTPPNCSGDAIYCGILTEQWRTRCGFGKSLTGGDSCGSMPSCTGDAIECYHAAQLWALQCKNAENGGKLDQIKTAITDEKAAIEANGEKLSDIKESIDKIADEDASDPSFPEGSGQEGDPTEAHTADDVFHEVSPGSIALDASGFGMTGECPIPSSITVGSHTMALQTDQACTGLGLLGAIVMLWAYYIAARIIAGGSW